MKIGIASDHAGFEMKEKLKKILLDKGHSVTDFGCDTTTSCDYPDFAHLLMRALSEDRCDVGVSLCGSGNGINMVANKYPKIRSALCWNNEIASLARKHNDANVCALPARFVSLDEAEVIVDEFLNTKFEGGRHLTRINKIPI